MTTGKTVPELTAETPPIVGTDEVVVYRSPGPLKRATTATMRTYMSATSQPLDADLTAIAALTSAADKMPYATGAQTWALADLTSFARTLLATASNSAFLTALGQIASSFVSFVNSGTGAVTRTLQAWLRERPVSVLDYYDAGDGNDYGPALVRAINASASVFFPVKSDGYRFASYVTATLTRDTIIDGNSQRFIVDQGRIQIKSTTVASGRTLAVNASRYATSVTINSATDIQVGDILHIETTIAPSSSATPEKKQDCVKVQAISGSVLALTGALNFAYTTADAGLTITIYRPVRLAITDVKEEIVATDADTTTYVGFLLTGLHYVDVLKLSVKGSYPFTRDTNIYRNGVWFVACWGVSCTNHDYEAISYGAGAYGGSRFISETNTKAVYCHHGNLDAGQWSSDYLLNGLFADRCYQGLSTHAVFRANAVNFTVLNDAHLSNWRVCGGSIRDGLINTVAVDADVGLPQFQNNTPNVGYEYINADADFFAGNVVFDHPNLTTAKPAFGVRYGNIVRYENITCPSDVVVGLASGEITTYINGGGNKFGQSLLSGPAVANILLNDTRSTENPRYDAVQVSFRRVINLRNLLLDQSSYSIRCYGQVVRQVDNGASVLRLHVNPFPNRSPAIVTGRITLRASVTSATAGSLFSSIEKDFEFCLTTGGGGVLDFNTTPSSTRGPTSSSGGTDITLTVSSPTLGSATLPDPYFDITINHNTSFGVTLPKFTIEYDLVLSDIGA